jgi:spermidine synthase
MMTSSLYRRADGVLAGLFFASGFAAILYQLVWQRMLYALVGIHVEAVTLIVALFIGGLGAGSLLGGLASRAQPGNLIGIFASVELAIGLYGAASPFLLHLVGKVAPHWGGVGLAFSVAAVVLPPTMAMGATLPLLVTRAVRHTESVGVAVGTLYSVNTLGSSIAAFAAGLLFMRLFGLSGVLAIAIACNLTVAAVALVGRRWLAL